MLSSVLALVLMMVALAVFSVVALTRSTGAGGYLDGDQLRGFVYVGAVATLALAVIVVVVAVVSPVPARADGLAVFGLFGCCAYQLGALIMLTRTTRRPRRSRGGRHAR